MISGRNGCELAVVITLCVLTIFFFPGIQGSYSVVHGPVTALRAAREAARVLTTIARSALKPIGIRLISAVVVLSWTSFPEAAPYSATSPEDDTILRC